MVVAGGGFAAIDFSTLTFLTQVTVANFGSVIDFVNFRSVSMANVGHFRPQNSICLGFEMSSFSFPVFDLLVFFSFYRFFPEDFPFSIFPGLELTRSGIVF